MTDVYKDEFTQLVQETFAFQDEAGGDPFQDAPKLPQNPGVLYRLEFGVSTFSIRGFACENIAQSYEKFLSHSEVERECLRWKQGDEVRSIKHFTLPFKEWGEVISDQLIGKRFPYFEEKICNLSDPGLSWWMEKLENGVHLFFGVRRSKRDAKTINLGPIGDACIAIKRFRDAKDLFTEVFDLKEFACTDNSVTLVSSSEENSFFQNFQRIFEKGEFSKDLESVINHRTLYYYLNEISQMRAFWINVEREIKNHLKQHRDPLWSH